MESVTEIRIRSNPLVLIRMYGYDKKSFRILPVQRTYLSCLDYAALAARAGAEHIKPALQRIYMSRASAYRDALKSFVEGYQEGIAEVSSKNSQEEAADSGQRSKEADGQSTKPSPADEPRKGKMPF